MTVFGRVARAWNRVSGYCRLAPLHQEDAGRRAQERERRAVLTGVAAAVARVAGVAASLVTVPITLRYLGAERFGLWMAMSSLLATVAFADFGIGNGVMNAVAGAHGRNDVDGIRRAVSSGIAVLAGVALVLVLVFAGFYGAVDWAKLFNVQSPLGIREAGPALFVFVVCFAFNIPGGVIQRAQMGLQEGFRSYLWQIAGSAAALAGVLAAVHVRAGLPWLLAALYGSPLIMTVLNAVVFFAATHRHLRPARALVSRTALKDICNLGGLFFVLQLVCGVAFYSDAFLIARVLGAQAVPEYAIPQRMFMMVSALLAMLTAPYWPAYAEALSRGDGEWVRRALARSLRIVIGVSAVAALGLLCASRGILAVWVGGAIRPSWLLLVGFAVWTVFDAGGNALAMFLNGAGIIRFQIIVAVIFGVACVAAKLLGVHYGVIALPWVTVLAYSVCHVIPCLFFVPGMLKKLTCPDRKNVCAA